MIRQLDQAKGTDCVWTITLRDDQGDPVTDFVDSATLAAVVWDGDDDSTAIATPSAAWLDTTEGTVDLTISSTDLADLDPGFYFLRLTITTGGRTYHGFEGRLRVLARPA